MKRVTAWYSSRPSMGEKFNHIEDGWSARDVPHGDAQQAEAWKGRQWRREHGWIDVSGNYSAENWSDG